ncbi:hypothetical protein D4L85_33420 [Chryseolinea soli]|uniref:Uncharacterized protein n=1 Tax=Chryseolinea soli TaxID=2321403 RepID=A0A385T225_9BACT|nr:hypothetical protein D4L85_33420 [Chryseolinea soli]
MFDIDPHPEAPGGNHPKPARWEQALDSSAYAAAHAPDETFLYNLPIHRLKPHGQIPPMGPILKT